MATPARYPDAIHIGTGEFSFCLGATTVAETRPPAGFRDFGNIDVYQLQIENESVEREGSYRGKKKVDASFSIKQSLGYMIRCDELTKDNLLMLCMGEDASDNARSALSEAAADTMNFSTTNSDTRYWYDLLVSDVQQTSLTSLLLFGGSPISATCTDTGDTFDDVAHGLSNGDRVILVTLTTTTGATILTPYYVVNKTDDTFQLSATAGGSALTLTTDGSCTYLAALTEDTDYEFDAELGRIRPLSTWSTTFYPYLTGAAITSSDTTYAKSITPLEEASFEGFGRLTAFHASDEKAMLEHLDFSCTITPANSQESTGKSPSMFDFIIKVTHTPGKLWPRKRLIN